MRTVGVAARAVRGDVGKVVTVTGYTAGVAVFGEDAAQSPGMSTLLRLLFANGAATVLAVRVDDAAGTADYEAAFQALGREEAQILVCDSAELEVQQALRTAVEEASPHAGNGSPWWAATATRLRNWWSGPRPQQRADGCWWGPMPSSSTGEQHCRACFPPGPWPVWWPVGGTRRCR